MILDRPYNSINANASGKKYPYTVLVFLIIGVVRLGLGFGWSSKIDQLKGMRETFHVVCDLGQDMHAMSTFNPFDSFYTAARPS